MSYFIFHIQLRFTSENIQSSITIAKDPFFFFFLFLTIDSITYSSVVYKMDFGVRKTWLCILALLCANWVVTVVQPLSHG